MTPAVEADGELEVRRYDTARATVYALPWPLAGDTRAVYVRHRVEDDHAGAYDVGEAAEATLDALETVAWRVETVDILNTPAWPVTADGDDADTTPADDTRVAGNAGGGLMTVRPPADDDVELSPRGRRARDMAAAVDHQGGPLYDVRTRGDEYRVDLDAGTCTCKDYEHREARCKHRRRVAIEVTDSEVPPPTAPRVTRHREHPDQGGARYYRCEGCGRESVRERLRRQGCRRCIERERETDDATDASAGYGGTAGLAADGGVETTSHTEKNQ